MAHRWLPAAALVLAGAGDGPAGVVLLALVGLSVPAAGGVVSYLVWIAAGAGVVGALGWAAGVALGLPPTTLLGAGLAVGGGVGAGARYLTVAEEAETGEAVTVEMGRNGDPDPEPVDLFEASPDPILFYGPGEDGRPVVRAANPAFEETMGAETTALAGTPLAEALFVVEDAADAADAVAAGESPAEPVVCETAAGRAEFRLRVAPVGEAGYVVYAP